MATATPKRLASLDGDQCVEMRGLDWKGYSTMLRLRGERSRPRLIYLDGIVFLMSPSLRHEDLKKLLGIFVSEVVLGLDIPCRQTGQTTFRRRKKEVGVEGDETFYLANAAQVCGKKEIDLRTDPPPDLAIEVVYTHEATAAIEVYRRLGVREVWIADVNGLQILVLRDDGDYTEAPTSVAFPFLTAAEIFSRVGRPDAEPNTGWHKDLRRWVRDVLLPRVAGPR